MQQRLFEYAIVHNPTPKRDPQGNEEPAKSTLIKDVSRTFAKSEQEIVILAAREIPTEYLDKLDEVEIKVRPF